MNPTDLAALVAALDPNLGRARMKAALICQVSHATMRHWLAGRHLPGVTTQAGALMLLEAAIHGPEAKAAEAVRVASNHPFSPTKT
jgi:hypothetical protein